MTMEKLIIEGNQKNPSIVLDPQNGVFEIKGNSIPEDANAFFQPIFDSLEEYFYTPFPLTIVNIALNYYNSSTSKWLLLLFQMLKSQDQKGNNVFIKWYYDEGDEESLAAAEDYSKMMNIPIRLLKAS